MTAREREQLDFILAGLSARSPVTAYMPNLWPAIKARLEREALAREPRYQPTRLDCFCAALVDEQNCPLFVIPHADGLHAVLDPNGQWGRA